MAAHDGDTTRRQRLILAAVGIALALSISEVAVRLSAPPQPAATRNEPADFSPFRELADGFYAYKPGARFAYVYDPAFDSRGYFGESGRVTYRTNNFGMRGADITPQKRPDQRRVLCLGDSFTFGEGVREPDTWPARLGGLLGPEYEVLNAGVQGYDLDHEALYLLRYGREFRPDIVVLAFFMNDAMPFGETVSHFRIQATPQGAPSALGRVSALWRLFEGRRQAKAGERRYLQDLRDSFRSEAWQQSRGRLSKLAELARSDGFLLVGMIFPVLAQLDGDYPLQSEHDEVLSAFAAADIPVVDLLEAYSRYSGPELWAHPLDSHPNEIAHEIAAATLASRLEALR